MFNDLRRVGRVNSSDYAGQNQPDRAPQRPTEQRNQADKTTPDWQAHNPMVHQHPKQNQPEKAGKQQHQTAANVACFDQSANT